LIRIKTDPGLTSSAVEERLAGMKENFFRVPLSPDAVKFPQDFRFLRRDFQRMYFDATQVNRSARVGLHV
jgi:hypothetical protein